RRRQFLRGAGMGLLVLKPETVFGTQANSAIEIGLIGCGSRGNMIGGLFRELTGARIAALHDVYPDRLEFTRTNLKSPDARLYRGYETYKELAASRLDAVVIESPPYCHPEQAAAAVDAGKHVFLAKPVAVDVAGCKSILASGEKVKGKSSFLVDFQFRAHPAVRECAGRIHRGDIGVPVVAHVFYHTGRLRPKSQPGDTPESARLRNWVFDKALSGDIIVEQNIHALDCGCWFLNGHPLKAYGTGGRKVRVDVGDCWDHFAVTYWFANNIIADFSSSQCIKGYNDICARIYGSDGTGEAHYGGAVNITGDKPWAGTEKANCGRDGVYENIRTFVEHVKAGKLLNNVAESVNSNLTAILGRMAAYQNRVVAWDEMMRSNEKLDLRLPKIA
ncbi:MAG: Gfo/Idh/MocA family oxidoreductase, partial [Acidobacteriota bacterium]